MYIFFEPKNAKLTHPVSHTLDRADHISNFDLQDFVLSFYIRLVGVMRMRKRKCTVWLGTIAFICAKKRFLAVLFIFYFSRNIVHNSSCCLIDTVMIVRFANCLLCVVFEEFSLDCLRFFFLLHRLSTSFIEWKQAKHEPTACMWNREFVLL